MCIPLVKFSFLFAGKLVSISSDHYVKGGALTLNIRDSLQLLINITHMVLVYENKLELEKTCTDMWREHANSTEKGKGQTFDLLASDSTNHCITKLPFNHVYALILVL